MEQSYQELINFFSKYDIECMSLEEFKALIIEENELNRHQIDDLDELIDDDDVEPETSTIVTMMVSSGWGHLRNVIENLSDEEMDQLKTKYAAWIHELADQDDIFSELISEKQTLDSKEIILNEINQVQKISTIMNDIFEKIDFQFLLKVALLCSVPSKRYYLSGLIETNKDDMDKLLDASMQITLLSVKEAYRDELRQTWTQSKPLELLYSFMNTLLAAKLGDDYVSMITCFEETLNKAEQNMFLL